MPRRRRCRYVALVVIDVVASGRVEVLEAAVSDPDAATEATARTGQEEAARDDRPCPRVPRRACPAMVHLCRPGPLSMDVLPILMIHTPVAPNRMDSDSPAVIRLDW